MKLKVQVASYCQSGQRLYLYKRSKDILQVVVACTESDESYLPMPFGGEPFFIDCVNGTIIQEKNDGLPGHLKDYCTYAVVEINPEGQVFISSASPEELSSTVWKTILSRKGSKVNIERITFDVNTGHVFSRDLQSF